MSNVLLLQNRSLTVAILSSLTLFLSILGIYQWIFGPLLLSTLERLLITTAMYFTTVWIAVSWIDQITPYEKNSTFKTLLVILWCCIVSELIVFCILIPFPFLF